MAGQSSGFKVLSPSTPLLNSDISSSDSFETNIDASVGDLPKITPIPDGHSIPNGNAIADDVDAVKLPCFMYLLTFLSVMGGFLFGYDTSVVSGAMLLLKDVFHLTAVWQEMIVSVTIASAAFFAFIGGFANDRIGRKPTIMLASIVFCVGSIFLACAINKEMLLIGRIIVGIGIGNYIFILALI